MKLPTRSMIVLLVMALLAGAPVPVAPASAADDGKVKEGAQQVESGAKQIGTGVADTAKGIGKTVVGGAETAGEKIKEVGEAAEPEAKTAWAKVRDGAVAFGHGVKNFFTNLFSN